RDFVDERPSRVRQPVLRQIADREGRRARDDAAIRLVEPGEHPQQRRLAGAVRTAQSDALTVRDLPRDRVEEHALAEALGEGLKLNHLGKPKAKSQNLLAE